MPRQLHEVANPETSAQRVTMDDLRLSESPNSIGQIFGHDKSYVLFYVRDFLEYLEWGKANTPWSQWADKNNE
jgi:hypothetical protein